MAYLRSAWTADKRALGRLYRMVRCGAECSNAELVNFVVTAPVPGGMPLV